MEPNVQKERPAKWKKCLVIQLNRGSAIPRQIDYVNERTNLKGKVRVYYKDQPYECSQCQTVHEGICPKRRAEKEPEEEKNWTVS